MKLHILGKNKKDKGSQLETLTKNILANQGYTNITLNYVGTGGHEIDVHAVKRQTVGVKVVEYPIICECKAHEKMISMPDYDKFKGKVATAKEENVNTSGLLIALSGAMGTVIGANDANKSDIQLIANDDLLKLISQLYSLPSSFDVRKYIRSITQRVIIDIDIVYYNNEIYWLIIFSKGDYCLYDSSFETLEPSVLINIQHLLVNVAPVSEYIDIFQEQKAFMRKTYIESSIIMFLMSDEVGIDDLLNIVKQSSIIITKKELKNYIKEIPFVTKTSDGSYALLSEEKISYIDFYEFILRGSVDVQMFSQCYYVNHIDDNLLEKIRERQHYIIIPNEIKKEVLFLLKHSPSALAYAIEEDKSITRYRSKDGKSLSERIDKGHSLMFLDNIMDRFDKDYCENSPLGNYYMNDLGIKDIIRKKELIINCNNGEKHIVSQEQDILLCKLQGYENTIVPVRKLPE
ncbi:MAG: restriction endonuclease [Bacteroidaceae bacterium]|nr:restriction endonuclease [Bacteroidaceae bacterium]